MTPYLLIGIGVFVVFALWRERRRATAMRALAGQAGFRYLGDALPKSFRLHGPLENVTKVWNVLDGDRNGVRILAFDCQFGAGKSAWRRTVIAAKSEKDPFAADAFDLNLSVERCDNWMILFRPRNFSFFPAELMPLSEIEAHLRAIGR